MGYESTYKPVDARDVQEHVVFSQPSIIMWVERKRLLNMREYGLADYENSEVKLRVPVEVALPVSDDAITEALQQVDSILTKWEMTEISRIQEFNDEFNKRGREARRRESVKSKWERIRKGLTPQTPPLHDRIVALVRGREEVCAEDIIEEMYDFDEERVLDAIIQLVTGWNSQLVEVEPGLYQVRNVEEVGE